MYALQYVVSSDSASTVVPSTTTAAARIRYPLLISFLLTWLGCHELPLHAGETRPRPRGQEGQRWIRPLRSGETVSPGEDRAQGCARRGRKCGTMNPCGPDFLSRRSPVRVGPGAP